MARRRPTNQPTKTLTHPNDPSITVTVQKLTRMQQAELAPIMAKATRAIQVEDHHGGPVVDPKTGEPRIVFQNVMTLEPIISRLRAAVVTWAGIADEQDKPIVFTGDNVAVLTEDWLDVTVNEDVTEDITDPETKKTTKKTTKKELTYAFSAWISNQLNNPKTWSADPFENASSTS